MVNLVKETVINLNKNGLDPSVNKAAVLAIFDDSGSAQSLYQSGQIQKVADMAFAAGLVFDDDGEVPAAFFSNTVLDLGNVNLSNCHGFIGKQTPRWHGTEYAKALQWIIAQAGYSHVDLGTGSSSRSGGFGSLFGKKSSGGDMSVKAKAEYPVFAIFVTDGQPQDPNETIALLIAMSQLPIFVQFVGVGPADFPFLEQLDELSGRFIDNAGFFDSKEASNESQMLEGLLNEFPEYYQKARAQGLIS
jgi:hypothetical protein